MAELEWKMQQELFAGGDNGGFFCLLVRGHNGEPCPSRLRKRSPALAAIAGSSPLSSRGAAALCGALVGGGAEAADVAGRFPCAFACRLCVFV